MHLLSFQKAKRIRTEETSIFDKKNLIFCSLSQIRPIFVFYINYVSFCLSQRDYSLQKENSGKSNYHAIKLAGEADEVCSI